MCNEMKIKNNNRLLKLLYNVHSLILSVFNDVLSVDLQILKYCRDVIKLIKMVSIDSLIMELPSPQGIHPKMVVY